MRRKGVHDTMDRGALGRMVGGLWQDTTTMSLWGCTCKECIDSEKSEDTTQAKKKRKQVIPLNDIVLTT